MDSIERNRLLLSRLVPLSILDLKALPWSAAAAEKEGSEHFMIHRGNQLASSRRPWYADEANTLARALAVLSFRPGGIDFMGLHFQSLSEPDSSAVAVAVPRVLTFEKGTLGRLVLSRGLRMQTTSIAKNPLIGTDPWSGVAKHHMVQLTDREGNTFVTHYSHGLDAGPRAIETVLLALGADALDAERYAGDVRQYAEAVDLDPEDPDTQRRLQRLEAQTRELMDFLGPGYAELLAIMEPGRSHV